MFFVYILVSKVDGSLYTGQSNDLKKRFHQHNSGFVKTTKFKRPYELGYYKIFPTRKEAMFREWELKKKWNTERKKKLIAEFNRSKIEMILGL